MRVEWEVGRDKGAWLLGERRPGQALGANNGQAAWWQHPNTNATLAVGLHAGFLATLRLSQPPFPDDEGPLVQGRHDKNVCRTRVNINPTGLRWGLLNATTTSCLQHPFLTRAPPFSVHEAPSHPLPHLFHPPARLGRQS